MVSAATSNTSLKACGTNTTAGYSYKNMASVSTSSGTATGTVKVYESDGNSVPAGSMYAYCELYNASTGTAICGQAALQISSAKTISASCSSSSASSYYCKGYSMIDSDNDQKPDYTVDTYQTATIS